MKRIGLNVLPMLPNSQELKRNLLYFDEILLDKEVYTFFLILDGWATAVANGQDFSVESILPAIAPYAADLDYLEDRGIVRATSILPLVTKIAYEAVQLTDIETTKVVIRLLDEEISETALSPSKALVKFISAARDAKGFEKQFMAFARQQLNTLERRAKIIACTMQLTGSNDRYIPILSTSTPPTKQPLFKEQDVTRIILKHFPIPDESVSLEQILDFKQDADNQHILTTLRRWMRDIATTNTTAGEIEEEVTYLVHEYERQMKLHKMKYGYSTFQTLVTSTLEVLENVVKLNWSAAAKNLFSIGKSRVDFLLEEAKLPGREIAYISKAKAKFTK